MIDDLRTFIDAHTSSIPGLSIGKAYTISTFHHGHGAASKVLFLIASEGIPVAIAKVMREKKDNALLEREYSALSADISTTFIRPAPYALGQIQGFSVSLEESIEGLILDGSEADSAIDSVATFVKGLSTEGTISALEAYAALEEHQPLPERAHTLADSLKSLEAGKTHGDCTFRNIVRGEKGLVLIDWSEYGLRPFLHIDLAHYLIRLAPKKDVIGIPRFVASYGARTGVPDDELEFLAYVDGALDVLKKRDRSAYEAVCLKLNSLVQP